MPSAFHAELVSLALTTFGCRRQPSGTIKDSVILPIMKAIAYLSSYFQGKAPFRPKVCATSQVIAIQNRSFSVNKDHFENDSEFTREQKIKTPQASGIKENLQ